MSASNKKKLTAFLALSMLSLASCADEIKYPSDYNDTLYPNITDSSVVENNWLQYYKTVLSSDNLYKDTLNQILKEISTIAHNNTTGKNGTDVTTILNDTFEGSVANDTLPSGTYDNLNERAEKSMISSAKSGTYSDDNQFYEKKFMTSLKNNFTLGTDFDETKINTQGKLITPNLKYSDIFGGDYSYYKKNSLYDDEIINYLTSEYIYTKSYSSIGNSLARNVQIVSLTDRTDEPGSAKKLLDAYIKDYIKGDKAGTDTDFSVLSRLWKGITSDFVTSIDSGRYSTRYDSSVVLSNAEIAWLKTNNIISSDGKTSLTLSGKVMEDKQDLDDAQNDYDLVPSDLENTYTGSYTYDYNTGVRKAIDDIADKDLVTKGIYTKSAGISSLPSGLTDRIFSTNMTTKATDITEMKKGTSKDITVIEPDGYRYLTASPSTGSGEDNLIYFDSSSKTYYLVRILDVVNNSAISSTSTDTIYDTAAKKEQIAREVAYAMSTTGSYKTESTVYWLRRTNIKYSDEDFLSYMKTNYKDLFKTDSSYDSEPKIDLSGFADDQI